MQPPGDRAHSVIVQRRDDFVREELQAVQPAVAVVPVVRHEDQRAEVAHAVPQGAELPRDLRRVADDEHLIEEIIEIAIVVALVRVALPHADARARGS